MGEDDGADQEMLDIIIAELYKLRHGDDEDDEDEQDSRVCSEHKCEEDAIFCNASFCLCLRHFLSSTIDDSLIPDFLAKKKAEWIARAVFEVCAFLFFFLFFFCCVDHILFVCRLCPVPTILPMDISGAFLATSSSR